jgi:hypothetical protein
MDGVELSNEESGVFDSNDATDGAPDTVGAVLTALGEYANGRPRAIIAWMPRSSDDLRGIDLVQEKQYFDVREVSQTLERRRRELLSQRDTRFFFPPEVVFGVRTDSFNEANGLDL